MEEVRRDAGKAAELEAHESALAGNRVVKPRRPVDRVGIQDVVFLDGNRVGSSALPPSLRLPLAVRDAPKLF